MIGRLLQTNWAPVTDKLGACYRQIGQSSRRVINRIDINMLLTCYRQIGQTVTDKQTLECL